MTFGDWLGVEKKKRDLSYGRMAELLKMSQSTLKNLILTGHSCGITEAIDIVQKLGYSAEKVLEFETHRTIRLSGKYNEESKRAPCDRRDLELYLSLSPKAGEAG